MEALKIFALCSLILFPIVVFWRARARLPLHVFAASGAAFGAVVAPWAFGLYSLIALGPYWAILGFPGLLLVWIHEPPGFHAATLLGFIPRGEVVASTASRVAIDLINGVFWALFYGLFGAGIDWLRRQKRCLMDCN